MKTKIILSILLTAIGVAANMIFSPDNPDASLWPRSTHEAPPPGKLLDIAIKDLGNFQYDPDDPDRKIPDDVLHLDGCKIHLRGYMVPTEQVDDIDRFLLVPSLGECCFGMPPTVQHTITVTCPGMKSVRYWSDEIAVEGTLSVKETLEDGFVVSLFEVTCNKIIPPRARKK